MSEGKTPKTPKASEPAVTTRLRQTIKLNESTNEPVPRTGIKRRTDIGDDTPTPPSPIEGEGEDYRKE